jgi:YegS/Rv2252/BmrU family lipid kinase
MTARAGTADAGPLVLFQPRAGRVPRPAPDLLIVHNPASPRFSAEEVRSAADLALGARGLTHRLAVVPASRDLEGFVRRQVARAIREGCRRIVAVGGDGTVGLVAQCVARRGGLSPPLSLGIIPAGTTNLLARELGIPLDLDRAFAVVAEAARAVELDAIRVGRRCFFTQVGIGPDALMIRDTAPESRKKMGRLAYMISFARLALRFRRRRFTLEIDGKVIHEHAWQIMVANVGSVGAPPFTWGPRIDPSDGVLDLCIVDVQGIRGFGKVFWRALTNRHRQDRNTRFYRVRDHVVVDSKRPVLAQGDGEIIGRTPMTLRAAPALVRVLVARAVEGTLPAADAAPRGNGSGTPAAPGANGSATPTAPPAPAGPAAPIPPRGVVRSVGEETLRMMALRSRTWALQGPLRHPIAALEAFDAAVFLKINAMVPGTAVDRAFELISRFIHYGEGWAAVVLLIAVADPRRGIRIAAETLPALWATMLTVNLLLKPLFRRRRPFIAFVKARVIGPRPLDFSFPSGHAAAGFAGAVLLGSHLPGWAPLFYVFAAAVGFSRIYLGVHYPSDVIIGGTAGAALALAYQALIQLLLAGA